jgi:hypothetical protein
LQVARIEIDPVVKVGFLMGKMGRDGWKLLIEGNVDG